jgi:diaminopimelate epimerase
MNRRVAVTKMHGTRNDFVILDRRAHDVDDVAALARSVCDRHTGIGADGLLIIDRSIDCDAKMRVLNADGSEAEMCGNGIRCVARYLGEAGEGEDLLIETLAGAMKTYVTSRGAEYLVRVVMGIPRIEAVRPDDSVLVSTGNPHLVVFRDRVDDIDLEREGEQMQSEFPDGINVHVAHVEDTRTMRVRHYERGVGLTMACGTGAVACAVAAISRGEVTSPVRIHVPGGELLIEWTGNGEAFMTGPAVRVFSTEIDVRVHAHA